MRYLIAKLICCFAGHDLILEKGGQRCRRCGEFEPYTPYWAECLPGKLGHVSLSGHTKCDAYIVTVPDGTPRASVQEIAQLLADTNQCRIGVTSASETVTAHPMGGRKNDANL